MKQTTDTSCDACGGVFAPGANQFNIDGEGILCTSCYDDYCCLCFEHKGERSILATHY